MVFITQYTAYDDEGNERIFAGPEIIAKSIEDAYLLLHFIGYRNTIIIGIKVGEIKWD